jgi:hypothetical protein
VTESSPMLPFICQHVHVRNAIVEDEAADENSRL